MPKQYDFVPILSEKLTVLETGYIKLWGEDLTL